tara:strand:- start:31 stop:279 length:249 start_codon:yes stop_codon:yes gene_type:complete
LFLSASDTWLNKLSENGIELSVHQQASPLLLGDKLPQKLCSPHKGQRLGVVFLSKFMTDSNEINGVNINMVEEHFKQLLKDC